MSSKKSSPTSEPKGYAQALSELEDILTEINNPKVDVDILSERVARASFLIAWCKERIASAQFSVDAIVASLDDDFDDEELDDEDYDEEDDFDDDEDDEEFDDDDDEDVED